MDTRIQDLSNANAVQMLRNVARRWIDTRGLEAFIVVDALRRKYPAAYEEPPSWLLASPATATGELAALSKLALSAMLDGERSEVANWVEDELDELQQARAQVLDPITLTIVGSTIIGIILASRVKKIGDVAFFKGVPKETVEMLKHATSVLGPKAS
jgi:hypothetical protein